MNRFALFASSLVAAVMSIGASDQAVGQTLDDALAIAYQTNPNLLAARAQLRATDELVAQAKAQRRPVVGIIGSMSAGLADNLCTLTGDFNLVQETECAPSSVRLDIVQPVFRGGSIEADIDQAENLVRAQRAVLVVAEQEVLLRAATAYLDVYRDQAVLDLTRGNESVVAAELKATRNRYNVGAVTETDVVQAESRLARATAQRIEAEGSLAVSKATYREFIGEPEGPFDEPPLLVELPPSEEEAIRQSASNPAVVAVEFQEKAARNEIDSAFGDLLPSLDLIGELKARDDLLNDSLFDEDQTASITARLKIPLYTAGTVDSQVRAAKHRAGQLRNQLDAQRRAAARAAGSTWQSLTTAQAQKVSYEAEVRAADLALKGVRREAEVGARTVLDILDAEQELLDARVNLVRARRDEIASAYAVLAAIGQLGAERLALDVSLYDVERHYESVRGKFWGTDIDEE
jgi:TolC family type I secretion outer membrane protein